MERGLTDVAIALLRNGMVNPDSIDAGGKSVLMLAVELGRKDMVEALLGNGCTNINARDSLERTALGVAVEKRDVAMTRIFLIAGANPNLGAGRCFSSISFSFPFPLCVPDDWLCSQCLV